MSSQEEQARALRDALLKDMQARKGFRRDHVDTETRNEWDEKWLDIITAALTQAVPKWTSEKPTKPGWYWWKDINGSVDVVQIIDDGEDYEYWRVVGRSVRWSLKNVGGYFAGPLSTPQETAR